LLKIPENGRLLLEPAVYMIHILEILKCIVVLYAFDYIKIFIFLKVKKVKISLLQAMEAHRVARG
jgi:hypothetical protein